MKTSGNSSAESKKHPYLRIKTYLDNPFWETGMYPEHAKQYYRKWLNDWIKNEKNMAILDPNLK